MIHKTAIIDSNAKISENVTIGPYTVIGPNVEIGGGSGVIKNIPNNAKVMGYPAKNIREFLRDNKWYTIQLLLIQMLKYQKMLQ